jgi:hypothetical protein
MKQELHRSCINSAFPSSFGNTEKIFKAWNVSKNYMESVHGFYLVHVT